MSTAFSIYRVPVIKRYGIYYKVEMILNRRKKYRHDLLFDKEAYNIILVSILFSHESTRTVVIKGKDDRQASVVRMF